MQSRGFKMDIYIYIYRERERESNDDEVMETYSNY